MFELINCRFIFFILASLNIVEPGLRAIAQPVKFHHITPDEQTGFGNVWAILEDHEGFMWFGTEDGLYKYDGYRIETFRHDKQDPTSISGNFITSLFEDSNHNLWIGTFGDGLNLYNRDQQSFIYFRHNPDDPFSLPYNRVKTIQESNDGTLWFGTEGGGIATYRNEQPPSREMKFDVIQKEPGNPNSLSSNYIRSIVKDSSDRIYVGTYTGGLTIISEDRRTFTHLSVDRSNPEALQDEKIVELFIDSRQRLWVGTLEAGLSLFLPKENKFVHYKASEESHTLNHNEVETITEDSSGIIWVGTDNGLSKMVDAHSPVPQNKFQNHQHEPLDKQSLVSNSVKIVYVDSRNSLWVGTYFGGINVYNSKLLKFHTVRQKPWLKQTLSYNNVTAFAEDKDGNLWIGTDGGGLNLLRKGAFNLYEDDFEQIIIKNPDDGSIETKVKSLQIDKNGAVWIGYWGSGLYRLEPSTRHVEHFGWNASSRGFVARNVLSLNCDRDNNIWIGTFVWGISYYDQEEKSFSTYLTEPDKPDAFSNERIKAILIDAKDRVWIGGDIGGLSKFNEDTETFEIIEYRDILTKDISILCLMEAQDGKIWIGTVSSGIIVYDPAQKTARSYTENEALPKGVIQAMVTDGEGRIWMSTSNGLILFDPDKEQSFSYTKDDGLQGNQFNTGSVYKCSSGMLIFGGTKGYNAFFPDSIKMQEKLPKIAFTNLWVNNHLMNVNIPGSPLETNLNSTRKLALPHDSNSFTIEFAALDYNFANRNRYAYWLEGFDKEWQYIENNRKATFTNLDPGTYELRVKASNYDGFWTERNKPLVIVIKAAWWQTSWFRVFLALCVIAVGYGIYRLRVAYLVRQKKQLEHEVHLRTSELKSINLELAEKNNEILAQNEELSAQNDHILTQREKLETAREELKAINDKLEKLVDKRTQKLKATIKQLDKTVLELDRFVYSASHDLSAPLKSIRGLLHIAKVNKDYDSILECLNYIDKSITRLENVIQSLVEYSRNAHYEISYEQVSVHEFINEIVDDLAYWPEFKSIKIHNQVSRDLKVNTDKARLKIILHNLISNSIKYADPEKNNSYIKISSEKVGRFWNLSITDNGIGIDKEHLNKIFEMYFRASVKSYGSGLGLYIVNETVVKLGGKIIVESKLGLGTTFTASLPLH